MMRLLYAAFLACGLGMSSAALAKSGSRPVYGGGKHTSSHGGTYQGVGGSSHKGGTYKNPALGDRYGKHK
jgi:hypothetical protein